MNLKKIANGFCSADWNWELFFIKTKIVKIVYLKENKAKLYMKINLYKRVLWERKFEGADHQSCGLQRFV